MKHIQYLRLNEQEQPQYSQNVQSEVPQSVSSDPYSNRSLWEKLIKEDVESLLSWVNYEDKGKLTSEQLRAVYELLSAAKEKARMTVLKNMR